jgi:hypothetical protein
MAQELAGPNFYSYDLQVETKINIDELIYILTPEDLPLLSGIGSDGLGVIGKAPVDNTVFYWMEEDVPLPRGTSNEALDSSETGVDVVAGDAVKFAVGDAIRIDDEIMLVTAINTSTEVLTVTRGALGSTAASHNTCWLKATLDRPTSRAVTSTQTTPRSSARSSRCRVLSRASRSMVCRTN